LKFLRRRYFLAIIQRAHRVALRVIRAEAFVYAGHLTFLTVIGLLPMLAVAYWLAEQSTVASIADKALREYLTTHLFPESATQALKTIEKLRFNARKLGLAAIIALLIDLTLKAQALNGAIRRVAEIPATWWRTLRALCVLLIVMPAVTAGVAVTINFFESSLIAMMPTLRSAVKWLFVPLHVSLPMWVAIYAIYRGTLAEVKHRRAVALAAACVVLALEAMRLIVTVYFSQLAQVKSLYGTFSALPIFLVSVFLSWFLVICGAAWLVESGRASRTGLRAGPSRLS
jgi:membrane protein